MGSVGRGMDEEKTGGEEKREEKKRRRGQGGREKSRGCVGVQGAWTACGVRALACRLARGAVAGRGCVRGGIVWGGEHE